jgi:hypothetical protein
MNKKGFSIVFMIIEIIIVVFVVYSTISIANVYGSSKTVNKINLASDIQMMVNTLVASPADAFVEYPGDVSEYKIFLYQDSVKVYIEGDGENQQITRFFVLPEGYSAVGSLVEKEKLCLKKSSRDLFLEECQ